MEERLVECRSFFLHIVFMKGAPLMIRTSMVMVGLLMAGTASGCVVPLEKEENPRQAQERSKKESVRAEREPVDTRSLCFVVKDALREGQAGRCLSNGHMGFDTCFSSAPVPTVQDY